MIIALTGLPGSGKDTVADHLGKVHGYVRMAFADGVKDAVASVYGLDRHLLEGKTIASRAWRETRMEEFNGNTPRDLLKMMGMHARHFQPDVWVNRLLRGIADSPHWNIVVTDVRMSNEMRALRDLDAAFWNVERGERPAWVDILHDEGTSMDDALPPPDVSYLGIHESDWRGQCLDALAFVDSFVLNNSTIDSLADTVDYLMDYDHA